MKKLFTPLFRPTMTRFPSKKAITDEAALMIASIHRIDTQIYNAYYKLAKKTFLSQWKQQQ
jgi:hypothetical protein